MQALRIDLMPKKQDRKSSSLRLNRQANRIECELPADDGESNTQPVSRYYHPAPTINPYFVAEKVNSKILVRQAQIREG